MKHALLVLFLAIICSCKKNEGTPAREQILNGKISDIIPQKYIDTLKKLGLNIYEGTEPPGIEGIYEFKPSILQSSNIAGDTKGQYFANAKVKFYDQKTSSFDIKLLGKMFLNSNDTSIKTAISGSGNNFTVYGNVKSVAANSINYATFAILFSGTMEGSSIKNAVYGIVNVDNSKGGVLFIKEGEARIIVDEDKNTPGVNAFRYTGSGNQNIYGKCAGEK